MTARRPARHDARRLTTDQLQAIAGLFALLSEPSRLRILQLLQAGPTDVGSLVDRTGFKQSNVSKQLGILLSGGVVARRQEGNKAIYSIALPLVLDLCELVCGGIAREADARAAALKGARAKEA